MIFILVTLILALVFVRFVVDEFLPARVRDAVLVTVAAVLSFTLGWDIRMAILLWLGGCGGTLVIAQVLLYFQVASVRPRR